MIKCYRCDRVVHGKIFSGGKDYHLRYILCNRCGGKIHKVTKILSKITIFGILASLCWGMIQLFSGCSSYQVFEDVICPEYYAEPLVILLNKIEREEGADSLWVVKINKKGCVVIRWRKNGRY